MKEPIHKRKASLGIAAAILLILATFASVNTVSAAQDPVTGKAYLVVPTTGAGVALNLELAGLSNADDAPGTPVVAARFAATGSGDSTCADTDLAAVPGGGFTLAGPTVKGGVFRAQATIAAFPGDATRLNAGEYVVQILSDSDIVACADLDAPIASPQSDSFNVGGAALNSSGITATGTINMSGNALNFNISFAGTELVDGQNHPLFLRSNAGCGTGLFADVSTMQVKALTNQGTTDPTTDLGVLFPLMPLENGAGSGLDYTGQIILDAPIDSATFATYGFVLHGFESATVAEAPLTATESQPSFCGTILDDSVAPVVSTANEYNLTFATVTPPVVNTAPTAEAGPAQEVTIAQGATTAPVTFAGMGTDTDVPAQTLTYAWTGPVALDPVAAPTADLPAGEHTFELTVTDDGTPPMMGTDTVVITVNPATVFTGTIADATTVAEILAASDYKPALHGEILSLYQAVLARQPDVPGAQYWINTIFETPGVLKSVNGTVLTTDNDKLIRITFFIATEDQPEYAAKYASIVSNEDFVDAVYMNVFGRVPDAPGKAFWVSELVRGVERPQMIRFLNASEEGICLNRLGRDVSSFTHPACTS